MKAILLLSSLFVGSLAFGAADLSSASLIVKGELGPSQKTQLTEATVCFVRTDSAGRYMMRDVDAACQDIGLNQTIVLTPGTYQILVTNSSTVIDLKAGEHKTVKLSKLAFPKTAGDSYVNVFHDLTDKAEQEKFLLSFWLNHDYSVEGISWKALCRNANLDDASLQACKIWNGGDYKQLAGTLVQFGNDSFTNEGGAASTFDWLWTDEWHASINHGITLHFSGSRMTPADYQTIGSQDIAHDGDFISVFPGTYGIETKSMHGDGSTRQLGVVVN